MPIPLIGITSSRRHSEGGQRPPERMPLFSIPEAYVQALIQAGACPVIIPLGLPESGLEVLIARLDGFLFAGGGDVAPSLYGSQPHPLVAEVDPDRDRLEIELFKQITRTGRPFLGICRGLQVINVALGGSLYEDIGDQRPNALRHQYSGEKPRDYLAHPVQIQARSRLNQILGAGQPQVNSLHHQGIRQLAPGLEASATAPDGIIEGIELPGYDFGLAVQWHPEWLQEHPAMRRLFEEFVQAAARGEV